MKNNLNSPANPRIYEFSEKYKSDTIDEPGFTKLELASLMIAQGMAHTTNVKWLVQEGIDGTNIIATYSVMLAKAVLEEANK